MPPILRYRHPSGMCYRHPSGQWGPPQSTNLYLAQGFSDVQGVANTYNIARVSSAGVPSAVGVGQDAGGAPGGQIRSMYTFGGELYVGADPTNILGGSTTSAAFATWDGSAWSIPGSSTNGTGVYAMAEWNDELYMGGDFTTFAGTASRNRIFNLTASSTLGTGMSSGIVRTLTVYDSKLIAGGVFNNAGGVGVANAASWNGSAWANIGTPAIVPRCSAVFDGALYLGGTDWLAPFPAKITRTTDLSTWTDLDMTGLNLSTVESMLVHGGELYVAGQYDYTGSDGDPARTVARFTDPGWAALGAELTYRSYLDDASVFRLIEWKGKLVVAGLFYEIGSTVFNSIGMYTRSTDSWSQFFTGGTEPGLYSAGDPGNPRECQVLGVL